MLFPEILTCSLALGIWVQDSGSSLQPYEAEQHPGMWHIPGHTHEGVCGFMCTSKPYNASGLGTGSTQVPKAQGPTQPTTSVAFSSL